MKTCLIAPIPDLDRFVSDHFKHHLLLDHLFDIPGWGETYAQFYKRRSHEGDFVTIDNGAKEHAQGVGLAQLLRRARQVEANEVVVADVRFCGRESLAASAAELHALRTNLRDEYEQAGQPQLMLVPHGETPIDWRNCMFGLETIAEHVLAEIDGPMFSLGIPYAYAHYYEPGVYLELIRAAVARVTEANVHLLGWPRELEILMNVTDEFPRIRSIDSSRPIVYAQAGEYARSTVEYPGRRINYFTTSTPFECSELVEENIRIFKAFALDG